MKHCQVFSDQSIEMLCFFWAVNFNPGSEIPQNDTFLKSPLSDTPNLGILAYANEPMISTSCVKWEKYTKCAVLRVENQ